MDNVIVYQEVLHSIQKRKVGKGIKTLKIDLEKSYDRLSWGFIRETLDSLGMPVEWVHNIMSCIETPTMSIFFNGKKLESFKPTRGIRQGDAISPYIFVICIKRLGNVIHEAVHSGMWKPIQYLSRNGHSISHIF